MTGHPELLTKKTVGSLSQAATKCSEVLKRTLPVTHYMYLGILRTPRRAKICILYHSYLKCCKCCTGGKENKSPKLIPSPRQSLIRSTSQQPPHITTPTTVNPHSHMQKQQLPPSPPSTDNSLGKMAPALQAETPLSPGGVGGHWRRASGVLLDVASISNGASRSVASRRVSRKLATAGESSNISNVVYSLKRKSGDELGATASSKLLNANHATLLDWIRHQRMSKIPPEGSSYDKVLAWAQLFVERLHSFDVAIEHFAGDSYLAAQLAYGYCAILLEVCLITLPWLSSILAGANSYSVNSWAKKIPLLLGFHLVSFTVFPWFWSTFLSAPSCSLCPKRLRSS